MRSLFLLLAFLLLIPIPDEPSYGSDRLFHGGMSRTVLNLDSLYAAAKPLAESPDGLALIEACMARYGGRQRLGELEGLRLHYRMQSLMSPESLDVVKSIRRGRRYRITRTGGCRFETRILNRARSWYQNPDTVIALTGGSRHLAELFSYLTLTMPLGIETEGFDGGSLRRRSEPSAPISLFGHAGIFDGLPGD